MAKIFRANPTQARFLKSQARFMAFLGGIGSGKTTAGVIKSIMKLADGDGAIVAPDYPHFCKSTWPVIQQWLPWSRVTNKHLNHPHTAEKVLKIATPQGERKIYYGGMQDAGAWAGPSLNWAFADEFRRVPTRQHFDVLAGRIRVGFHPQLWLTTTPKAGLKGRKHWLYEVFVEQKFDPLLLEAFANSDQELVNYFNAPTKENEHNLDPLYLASLSALYTGKYAQQELGGEFIELAGQVLSNFSEDDNVSIAADYVPGVPIEWGVDDGFTAGHPRVILMGQVIPPFFNIFAEYFATFENAEVSIANALGMGYPQPVVARVDSSAAELIHRLWDKGIETYRGSHPVEEGIAHLRSFVRDGNGQVHVRFHPRCEFAISEIQAYMYPETVESNLSAASPRAARPLKESDNAADALRYMVWPKQIETLEVGASIAAGEVVRVGMPAGVGNYPTPRTQPYGTPGQMQEQAANMPLPQPVSQTQWDPQTQQLRIGIQQELDQPLQASLDRRRGRGLFSVFGAQHAPRPSRRRRQPAEMPPGW